MRIHRQFTVYVRHDCQVTAERVGQMVFLSVRPSLASMDIDPAFVIEPEPTTPTHSIEFCIQAEEAKSIIAILELALADDSDALENRPPLRTIDNPTTQGIIQ